MTQVGLLWLFIFLSNSFPKPDKEENFSQVQCHLNQLFPGQLPEPALASMAATSYTQPPGMGNTIRATMEQLNGQCG